MRKASGSRRFAPPIAYFSVGNTNRLRSGPSPARMVTSTGSRARCCGRVRCGVDPRAPTHFRPAPRRAPPRRVPSRACGSGNASCSPRRTNGLTRERSREKAETPLPDSAPEPPCCHGPLRSIPNTVYWNDKLISDDSAYQTCDMPIDSDISRTTRSAELARTTERDSVTHYRPFKAIIAAELPRISRTSNAAASPAWSADEVARNRRLPPTLHHPGVEPELVTCGALRASATNSRTRLAVAVSLRAVYPLHAATSRAWVGSRQPPPKESSRRAPPAASQAREPIVALGSVVPSAGHAAFGTATDSSGPTRCR
jgi:hypothetical protein